MSNIILQPCGNRAAQQHYADTMESPVALETMDGHLSIPDIVSLETFSTDGAIRVWGAKPGEDGRNERRWKRISPGDYLLFIHGQGRTSAAQIVHTFQSSSLARELWGQTETANGVVQTWELMFALKEPQDFHLPSPTLNELIGRKPNAAVQEFVVLDLEPSAAVLTYLALPDSPANPTVPNPPTRQGRQLSSASRAEPEFDELDEQVRVVRRLEQAYLRKYILPGNSGRCALCGRVFPIEFLVAAHIKRRSQCSDVEKRDFNNIAMPNCTFGCDQLFGRGLVSVDQDGKVEVSALAPDVGPVAVYIAEYLVGKEVDFWKDHPGSRSYFDYHRSFDFAR